MSFHKVLKHLVYCTRPLRAANFHLCSFEFLRLPSFPALKQKTLGIMSKTQFSKKLSLNHSDVTIQITKYLKLLPKATLLAKRHFSQAQEVLSYTTFNKQMPDRQSWMQDNSVSTWGWEDLKWTSIRPLWITFKRHKKGCLSRTTNQSLSELKLGQRGQLQVTWRQSYETWQIRLKQNYLY